MTSSVIHPFFLTYFLLSLLAVSNCLLLVESLLSSNEGTQLTEDKFRLGSMPPSCHNRCRLCSPCTAVQVPTLPPSKKVIIRPSGAVVSSSPSSFGSQYSNYKPLGWKCRCGDRLYDP